MARTRREVIEDRRLAGGPGQEHVSPGQQGEAAIASASVTHGTFVGEDRHLPHRDRRGHEPGHHSVPAS